MKIKLFSIIIISSLYSQSIVTDTLSYRDVATDSFHLYLNEIGLVVHKMPVDGIIKKINIPIASWGDSSGAILVEMYKLNYPLDSTGNQYDSVYFDENGWLGYYPNTANDSLLIPYIPYWNSSPVWNSFGDSGVCTGRSLVPNNFPPLYELIWYGDFTWVKVDPSNFNLGDNWISTIDYLYEYEFNQGDNIGIFIKYYQGDTISPISFFAGYNTEYNDPWRFLLFSPQCSGISDEGGWHIRSVTVNLELEIEYEPLSTEQDLTLPSAFQLKQNYPNPFNPVTTISYQLQTSAFVNLSIYNINGQLVETVENKVKSSGYHVVTWNANRVGAGVYFYRIRAGEYSDIKKCIVLK